MLVILLHGVGSEPADMAPLAAAVAACRPDARIEAPAAPMPYDLGPHGHQWFSVAAITDENRPARTHAAVPALVDTVRALQDKHDAAPDDTVLMGFSQGASMALAACEHAWLARHVVAIAGRCMPLPERWDRRTAVSLVHGRMDGVVPHEYSVQAAARLEALGAAVRLDLVPRTVHLLSPRLVQQALAALLEAPA